MVRALPPPCAICLRARGHSLGSRCVERRTSPAHTLYVMRRQERDAAASGVGRHQYRLSAVSSRSRASTLTGGQSRSCSPRTRRGRIASNFAKLPELLRKSWIVSLFALFFHADHRHRTPRDIVAVRGSRERKDACNARHRLRHCFRGGLKSFNQTGTSPTEHLGWIIELRCFGLRRRLFGGNR